MYGLAAHNKPRLAIRLASGFQNNPTGLNNSQEFARTLLILVVPKNLYFKWFIYTIKNCQILMKKIRGWHDAVFRLGQETHQIPFVNLKRTR